MIKKAALVIGILFVSSAIYGKDLGLRDLKNLYLDIAMKLRHKRDGSI